MLSRFLNCVLISQIRIMKNRIYTIAVVLIVFAFNPLVAQNLNDIQRGQRGYSPPPMPREQGAISIADPLEDIDQKMDLYQEEFTLDAFEKAVLKNYLVEFETEKLGILENETISYDVKQQAILKLNDKLSAKLITLLTEEEVVKFQALHFDTRTKRQKRKDKNKT